MSEIEAAQIPASVYYNTENYYHFPQLDLNPENIEFNKDSIKCGTVDTLIENATNHLKFDNKFLFSFLLTYRSFISPCELLMKLVVRYMTPPPVILKNKPYKVSNWLKVVLATIRIRVVQLLKFWVTKHFYDFETDLNLIKGLEIFITIMKVTNGSVHSKIINNAIRLQVSFNFY